MGTLEVLSARLDVAEKLADERDRHYAERDKDRQIAISAALTAADKLNSVIFAASEKAIEKADANAEKWRQNANEWRAAMSDREMRFASREEVSGQINAVNVAVASLKESRAESVGGKHLKDESRANLAILVAIISALLSIVFRFVKP